jgi:hypothetical protein
VILNPGEVEARLRVRVVQGPGRIVQHQVRTGSAFQHGADLLRIRVEPLTTDTQVEMQGEVPVDIAFSERLVPSEITKAILESVRVIVREFEPIFGS